MTQPLTYQIDRWLPIAIVRLRGELSAVSSGAARAGLFESLMCDPTSVVIDMSKLRVADDAALCLLMALAEQARRWPGAPLLAGGPQPPVAAAMRRLAIDQQVRVYPTVEAALEAAAGVPAPLRLRQHLPPTVYAPRTARQLVLHACWEWGLPQAMIPAELISSELVTNAVRHARTPMDLALTLRGDCLRISVRDGAQQEARLQTPSELDDHGRGLLIVDTVATAWGNMATAHGKAVWASLRVSRGRCHRRQREQANHEQAV